VRDECPVVNFVFDQVKEHAADRLLLLTAVLAFLLEDCFRIRLEERNRRRMSLVRSLAKSVAESSGMLSQLAQQLRVGERALREDLRAVAEGELEPTPRLPEHLVTALAAADTAEALWAVERGITSEAGAGRVSSSDAEFFLRSCRELRQTLKEWKKEVPAGDLLSTGLGKEDGGTDAEAERALDLSLDDSPNDEGPSDSP